MYVEINGLSGKEDTTLPLYHSSRQEHASIQTTSTNKTEQQEGCVRVNKTTGISPPWNALGAKPKTKSGQATGRTQRPEICDATGWPALPSSSTPVQRKAQPWITAKGKRSNKTPKKLTVQLQNRFAPLLQDPRSDHLDNPPHPQRGVRSENSTEDRKLRGKLTGPQTLIVGDLAIKDVRRMCSNNTKVLYFPKDMVSDTTDKILSIVAENPTVKNLVLHTGANDIVKQQSEILKKDFNNLLNTVRSLNAEVFISGPLPPVRGGTEKFSRLLALNTWLSTACDVHSVHFIDNFNHFWDRRHLFKGDGLSLNKSGVVVTDVALSDHYCVFFKTI
uniref:SGNH hydrolase-type esterase domain-containing protein n=1 Tax=Mastacembelus armatus TaxID=205130 RepID=A0A3Q3SCN1_9TELE